MKHRRPTKPLGKSIAVITASARQVKALLHFSFLNSSLGQSGISVSIPEEKVSFSPISEDGEPARGHGLAQLLLCLLVYETALSEQITCTNSLETR